MFWGSRARITSFKLLPFIGIIALFVTSCNSTEAITFTAKGCCPTCEKFILESLQIDEVKSAQWDQHSEKVTLRFYTNKITAEQLQRTVAMAGYDTDLFVATDSVYLALPQCCQYRD
jgi:hypothetical protein